MSDNTEPLSCGHPPTQDSKPGTGYATLPDDKRICYPCADEMQREEIKTADVFTAYLASTHTFTTWTGGELGKVTSYHLGRERWTTHTRYRMRYVTVRTPDGAEWYGRGSDQHDVITIRRKKSSPKES